MLRVGARARLDVEHGGNDLGGWIPVAVAREAKRRVDRRVGLTGADGRAAKGGACQPSPMLSGGEARRIALVTELSKVRDGATRRRNKAPRTPCVLDEPTVSRHMVDVGRLIRVLRCLVDAATAP